MALFLSWRRPSAQQQQACIDRSGGDFNYDATYRGATSGRHGSDKSEAEVEAALSKGGFHVNRERILLGSGADTFRRAEAALRSWRHFRLGWAFVEPGTPVAEGTKFCVCVREFLPWIAMPLQVAYVTDASAGGELCGGYGGPPGSSSSNGGAKACFGFGSGTLRGHLLAGEERFSVEWDENDRVYYDVFSFSKPAHVLSTIGYPYVRLRQELFARESARAILSHVASQQSHSPRTDLKENRSD